MMKVFLMSLLLTFSNATLAQVKSCGLYGIKGKVKLVDKNYVIKTQEDTLSEVTILVTDANEQIRLNAYENSSFEGEFYVKKLPLTPYQIQIDKMGKMQRRVSNPINPKDTGIYLIQSQKCLK